MFLEDKGNVDKTAEIELTPIVDVGLKATLIVMISPFDMPPYR